MFGDDQSCALLQLRLQAFLEELGPNPLTDAQQRVTELVHTKKAQLVHESVADLGRWQGQQRALANHLEVLEQRAASAPLADLEPAEPAPASEED